MDKDTNERPSGKPIPVRLPATMRNELSEIVRINELSQADALKLAVRIGLRYMRKKNYDIADAFIGETEKKK